MTQDLSAVIQHFLIHGDFISAAPYGNGHINDTFAVVMNQGGATVRYLTQRINHGIFTDVSGLMENVACVCTHLQARLAQADVDDASRRALTLIPTRQGGAYHVDADGNYWRVYIFIEGATGHEVIADEAQAYEVAKAFGDFQKLLVDLPGGPLNETIVDFHHTPKRFAAFEAALAADSHNRAAMAKGEIDFVLNRRELAGALIKLAAAGLPMRATHNDTKLNNVLIDDATNQAACVIDLDTLMPGLSLYDFGDLVRTSTSPAVEDEQDLGKVTMQLNMFDALVRGFIDSAGEALTQAEIANLPLGGQVITFECGVRFLTDFLQGDTYFRTRRENHNLDRCRTQFALVRSMEEQAAAMAAAVARASGKT